MKYILYTFIKPDRDFYTWGIHCKKEDQQQNTQNRSKKKSCAWLSWKDIMRKKWVPQSLRKKKPRYQQRFDSPENILYKCLAQNVKQRKSIDDIIVSRITKGLM